MFKDIGGVLWGRLDSEGWAEKVVHEKLHEKRRAVGQV